MEDEVAWEICMSHELFRRFLSGLSSEESSSLMAYLAAGKNKEFRMSGGGNIYWVIRRDVEPSTSSHLGRWPVGTEEDV